MLWWHAAWKDEYFRSPDHVALVLLLERRSRLGPGACFHTSLFITQFSLSLIFSVNYFSELSEKKGKNTFLQVVNLWFLEVCSVLVVLVLHRQNNSADTDSLVPWRKGTVKFGQQSCDQGRLKSILTSLVAPPPPRWQQANAAIWWDADEATWWGYLTWFCSVPPHQWGQIDLSPFHCPHVSSHVFTFPVTETVSLRAPLFVLVF